MKRLSQDSSCPRLLTWIYQMGWNHEIWLISSLWSTNQITLTERNEVNLMRLILHSPGEPCWPLLRALKAHSHLFNYSPSALPEIHVRIALQFLKDTFHGNWNMCFRGAGWGVGRRVPFFPDYSYYHPWCTDCVSVCSSLRSDFVNAGGRIP